MTLPEGQVNTRYLLVVLLPLLSAPLHAADTVILLTPNPLGWWLIIFGVAFLLAEATLPNYGVIGLGGIVLFVMGAIILNNVDVPLPLIVGLGLLSALLLIVLLIRAVKTRPRHKVSGDAGLLGSVAPIARLEADDACNGWVMLQGEPWRVSSATPLQPGQRVRVMARKGLLLRVTAADAALNGE
ncbi:NfeD family protein [Pseudomonas sp. Pseusp122]|uniref:NfeD family protein n=1 Tax=unclassified Pseudomonas TaxID=196821 RepID=UPI0039A63E0A